MAQIFVSGLDGDCIAINADHSESIQSLKKSIHARLGITPENQTLEFGGRTLVNYKSVGYYGMKSGCTVSLSTPLKGGMMHRERMSSSQKVFAITMSCLAILSVCALVATLSILYVGNTDANTNTNTNTPYTTTKRSTLQATVDPQIEELQNKLAALESRTILLEAASPVPGPRGARGYDGIPGKCTGVLGHSEIQVGHISGGWRYYMSGDVYQPMEPINAKVGDHLIFHNSKNGNVDLWKMYNEQDWINCNDTTGNATRLEDGVPLRSEEFVYEVTEEDLEAGTLYFACLGNVAHRNFCASRYVKIKVTVSDFVEAFITTVDNEVIEGHTQAIVELRAIISQLSQTIILQQVTHEQRVRSEGGSGITVGRGYSQGLQSYHDGTFGQNAIMNIHNHANNQRTMGMGEIQAVLNGVEFQTRHNDYTLAKPCFNDTTYHCTETVDFPEVPPAVLNLPVDEQVAEMQAWFKAWKDQDWSVRDYRPYFRPVLTYLEGAWIKDTGDIDEPFNSDRHFIDAENWRELHDKYRFLFNSGRKNNAENVPYLPASIRNLINDSVPEIANWEYRILVAPIGHDIPTSKFRIHRDLHKQLYATPLKVEEMQYSRRARWELNPALNNDGTVPQPQFVNDTVPWEEGYMTRGYLDVLMEGVPGKDNYGAFFPDVFEGAKAKQFSNSAVSMNAAHYSRYYKVTDKDAMGVNNRRRGFNDAYLWTAHTTQEKVVALSVEDKFCDNSQPDCENTAEYGKRRKQRWTYAIPLEIVYLTPLTKWNPYNITYHGDKSDIPILPTGQRDGTPDQNGCDSRADQAFNGTNRKLYYRTPKEFFASNDENRDPADTSAVGGVCVLDQAGVPRRVEASGHWIVFPEIGGGVGQVRQRYPIPPIHASGSTTWKELEALKDILISSYDYENDQAGKFGDSRDLENGFTLSLRGGGHDHDFVVKSSKVRQWVESNDSSTLTFTTEKRNNHQHKIKLSRSRPDASSEYTYTLELCKFDGGNDAYTPDSCLDGHNEVVRL